MDATIKVSGLRELSGPTVALDGLSFTVRPGHVTRATLEEAHTELTRDAVEFRAATPAEVSR
jgi:hypothetical protein